VRTNATRLFWLLAVGTLFHSAPGAPQPGSRVLEFVKKIGVGFRPDVYGWMSFVSFSPDGKMVASNGPASPEDVSGDLKLWSFPDGHLIKRFTVKQAAISPDWNYYSTSAGVTEMATGRAVISSRKNSFAGYTFSPDSHYVVETGTNRDHSIRVLELPSGGLVKAFGKSSVSDVAISPDGQMLAAGYWDLVTLWSLSSGERMGVLRGFKRYVAGLSFSPDGKLLAAGTDVGAIQVWEVGSRSRILSLDLEGVVSGLAFSPDGGLLAVGTYGTGTVWLIDVKSRKIVDHKRVSDMGCGSVAFSPDGRFLITPSTGGLITYPYDRGGTIRVFKVNKQ
jgi:WD40 repeat protein